MFFSEVLIDFRVAVYYGIFHKKKNITAYLCIFKMCFENIIFIIIYFVLLVQFINLFERHIIFCWIILFFFIILQYLCIWNWNVIHHTLITCYILAIDNITCYVIIICYCMFFGFVILSKLVSLNYTYPIRRNICFIILKVLLNKFMHYHLEVFRVWIILGIKFLIAANRILIIKC